ncbi:single-stranded DNA-binding protein [Aneurinibacillus aneurinilyticus]|nr:single-stranded DNA-binding protein [Aneurinibacillus aneurinilyticus]MED0672325.1 single-stranded DNA-binding protein [Aneurinibacillus aneurinilyticus]MED0706087.1 single-stranded DNA-binding protein [Aneurinibacillus aneurinilyticus]MED0723270.1 single-stranded DNA-binding protein [Aneurinibacillus aneurinilyticus]MED0732661.1 single-stranded DNA-binding protein [Aneurinibacillus aneurinilyticus]MED0739798.1 single-stranded DNA-binding protein [Aneurinibacillus aneurinilyticus]
MLNRVILIGRLTKDPELRYTQSGTAVATFTLAVDRRVTNQQGERETDFISVVVWSKQAELCAQYLNKGRQTAVEGRLQVRNYENNEGRRVYVTEVVAENVQFLGSGQGAGAMERREASSRNENPFAEDQRPIDISDDDLPF